MVVAPVRNFPAAAEERREERREEKREERREEKKEEKKVEQKVRDPAPEQDRGSQKKEEEEKQRRKEQEDRWRQLQLEREAKAAEEARVIEEMKRLAQSREEARKKNLAGMFALDNDLDEDVPKQDVPKRQGRGLAKSQDVVASTEAVSSTALAKPSNENSKDPVNLRASLADPATARSHNPGDVARQFQLLAEMKRKYRGREFGGPEAAGASNRKRSRSRSRSRRRRRSRSRSGSRSKKYDSLWMRSSK